MSHSMKKNNRGQTAVESILMIAVVAAIVTSVLSLVKKRLGDPKQCQQAENKKKLLCTVDTIIQMGSGTDGKKFQFYPFKK